MTTKPFNAGEPLAYFLTWTTYGRWLPGDERGWHRKHEPDPQQPNALFSEMAASRMTEPEFRLSTNDREIVEATIRKHCDIRGWSLHAVNVRTNHVHAVVAAAAKPERIADAMKAFATKRLRELGLVGANERVWSRGRSRRYRWKPRHVEAAVDYVLYCQGDVPFETDGWVG